MSTDFSRNMAPPLAQGDPAAVRVCGDLWSDVAGSLYSRTGDLEQQLRAFSPYWTGTAAEQYKQMIRSLIGGVRQTADVARLIADNVYRAGEALAQAMRYPPHQALPLLAKVYADLEAAIPPLPRVAGPPLATEVLTGLYRPDPALLFSGVYGNGLASAAAALGGGFARAVPQIIGPIGAADPPVGSALPPGGESVPPPGRAASIAPVSLASVSSGVAPISLTASSVPETVAPVPAPSVQQSGASAPVGNSFFPPMMPFGGAPAGGGDGFGNDRAVPVWLTEPEPDVVFGVPLQAVISVIGGEGL